MKDITFFIISLIMFVAALMSAAYAAIQWMSN